MGQASFQDNRPSGPRGGYASESVGIVVSRLCSAEGSLWTLIYDDFLRRHVVWAVDGHEETCWAYCVLASAVAFSWPAGADVVNGSHRVMSDRHRSCLLDSHHQVIAKLPSHSITQTPSCFHGHFGKSQHLHLTTEYPCPFILHYRLRIHGWVFYQARETQPANLASDQILCPLNSFPQGPRFGSSPSRLVRSLRRGSLQGSGSWH